MKKTFDLNHPKIKYPRMVDAVKHDIRKYLKRERRKELPEGADFWDFDCRFGDSEAVAVPVHLAEIDARINAAAAKQQLTFYVEIVAKSGFRNKSRNKAAAEDQIASKPLEKLTFRGFGTPEDDSGASTKPA